MLSTRRIMDRNEMEKWCMNLTGKVEIPPFLYDDNGLFSVVVGLQVGKADAGIAYGIAECGGAIFYLRHIFLAKAYRQQRELLYLLEALLRAAKELPSVEGAIWKYMLSDEQRDPYQKLIQKISFCQIEKRELVRQFGIRTADFAHLRKYQWYDPGMLTHSGGRVERWVTYDNKWKETIRAREINQQPESDYLSPFIESGTWKADNEMSFVLTEVDTAQPLGWIICERISEKEIKLRRFFMYKEARKRMLGPAFSTYLLDLIASRYEYLYFDIVPGNRQMEMFARVYCKPVLDMNYLQGNLKIKFKEVLL